MKRFRLALAALTAGLPSAVLATPAQADSYNDCPYPYVCMYEGSFSAGTKFAQYKDTYYQNMSTNRQNRADSVVNTRNDDSVWLLDTGPSPDRYICIPRNTRVNLGDYAHPNGGTWANDVDTIRIWGDPDDGTCSGSFQVRQGSVPDGWRR